MHAQIVSVAFIDFVYNFPAGKIQTTNEFTNENENYLKSIKTRRSYRTKSCEDLLNHGMTKK